MTKKEKTILFVGFTAGWILMALLVFITLAIIKP